MRKVYILRGVPGSGKSTFVNKTLEELKKDHGNRFLSAAIASADDYFIRCDGTYDWNPKLLKNAHEVCRLKFERALENDVEVVFVDNTNIKEEHYQKYVTTAENYQYDVEVKVVGDYNKLENIDVYFQRNVHGVP